MDTKVKKISLEESLKRLKDKENSYANETTKRCRSCGQKIQNR